MSADYPEDLRYTKDHEWARIRGNVAQIGITRFAVEQLGDVTQLELPREGESVKKDEVFGTIESVKTLSDLFAPVSGTVEKINADLEAAPERVNEDCWDKGWMIVIHADDPKAVDALLEAKSYSEHIASLEH